MKWARTFHTLTVLPDGDVLALGGQSASGADSLPDSPVLEPEIWDPGHGHVDADGAAASGRAATTTPRCCCPTGASCWPAAAGSTAR